MIVINSETLNSYLAFDILIETHQWTTNGPRGVPTTLDAVLRWLQVTVVTSGPRFDGESGNRIPNWKHSNSKSPDLIDTLSTESTHMSRLVSIDLERVELFRRP